MADATQTPTSSKLAELLEGKTYRSLGQQQLSPAEERFERARRTLGLFLGPALFLVMLLLPLDLEPQQQRLAAVLVLVIVWWVTEAIPIPIAGLLGIALCVLLQVAAADDVVAGFGSTTIFLFIGAFIVAQAMLSNGLAQRFAFRVLAVPGVATSTYRTIIAFGVITALLSAFVSNTATVAMLLPTAVGILGALVSVMQRREGEEVDPTKLRLGTAMMLMLAYGAGVGGLLTPVGSPPNIIGRGLIEEALDIRISFFDWVLIAVPLCLVMFAILAAVLLMINRPETRHIQGLEEFVTRERARMGRFSPAERNTMIAFLVAVTLWITPGIVGLIYGDTSDVYATWVDRLDEGIVALIAAGLLFLLPTNWARREFTLDWSDAANIDWGTILLFGAGIIFGSLLGDTGLAEQIGTGLADGFGVSGTVGLTIFGVILAILISETTSNTASASIVVPIVLPVAQAANVDPLVPAMAAVFGASFGFMLPVSTPQNAIVYGSGMVPITRMIRSGVVFDVLGAILLVVGVPVMIAAVGVG